MLCFFLLAYVCLYYFLAWVVGGCFSRRLPSRHCFCSPSSIDRSHVRVQSTASGQPRPACKTQGLRAPFRSPGCCVCAVCFAFSMLSYVRTRVCECSARGVCLVDDKVTCGETNFWIHLKAAWYWALSCILHFDCLHINAWTAQQVNR